ncbi:TolB family protein [Mycobacterium kansasii]|uniref:TolB family protein n=1 Tax=Mycobacterium kansasii TaxID=1768 RepID=UPI0018AD3158|nr:PD40 domain-containing protein [Mycobacterium kansasii]
MIVYTSQVAQVNSLHIMNADGSGERVLRPPDPPAESAVFSPDGHKIAYIAGKPAQVFVTDSDLKSARPLTKAVAAESHINESVALAFSPDGKTVAYVESATGGSSIYVVDATGGEPRQLMAPFGASEAPVSVPPLRVVFTPDSRAVVYDRLAKADFGQRLVFATIADVVQGDKTDELTLPVPEGVIATREDFRGVPAQLGYSRDGKKIVYQLSVSRAGMHSLSPMPTSQIPANSPISRIRAPNGLCRRSRQTAPRLPIPTHYSTSERRQSLWSMPTAPVCAKSPSRSAVTTTLPPAGDMPRVTTNTRTRIR